MTNLLDMEVKRETARLLKAEGKSHSEIARIMGYTSKSPVANLLRLTPGMQSKIEAAYERGYTQGFRRLPRNS